MLTAESVSQGAGNTTAVLFIQLPAVLDTRTTQVPSMLLTHGTILVQPSVTDSQHTMSTESPHLRIQRVVLQTLLRIPVTMTNRIPDYPQIPWAKSRVAITVTKGGAV